MKKIYIFPFLIIVSFFSVSVNGAVDVATITSREQANRELEKACQDFDNNKIQALLRLPENIKPDNDAINKEQQKIWEKVVKAINVGEVNYEIIRKVCELPEEVRCPAEEIVDALNLSLGIDEQVSERIIHIFSEGSAHAKNFVVGILTPSLREAIIKSLNDEEVAFFENEFSIFRDNIDVNDLILIFKRNEHNLEIKEKLLSMIRMYEKENPDLFYANKFVREGFYLPITTIEDAKKRFLKASYYLNSKQIRIILDLPEDITLDDATRNEGVEIIKQQLIVACQEKNFKLIQYFIEGEVFHTLPDFDSISQSCFAHFSPKPLFSKQYVINMIIDLYKGSSEDDKNFLSDMLTPSLRKTTIRSLNGTQKDFLRQNEAIFATFISLEDLINMFNENKNDAQLKQNIIYIIEELNLKLDEVIRRSFDEFKIEDMPVLFLMKNKYFYEKFEFYLADILDNVVPLRKLIGLILGCIQDSGDLNLINTGCFQKLLRELEGKNGIEFENNESYIIMYADALTLKHLNDKAAYDEAVDFLRLKNINTEKNSSIFKRRIQTNFSKGVLKTFSDHVSDKTFNGHVSRRNDQSSSALYHHSIQENFRLNLADPNNSKQKCLNLSCLNSSADNYAVSYSVKLPRDVDMKAIIIDIYGGFNTDFCYVSSNSNYQFLNSHVASIALNLPDCYSPIHQSKQLNEQNFKQTHAHYLMLVSKFVAYIKNQYPGVPIILSGSSFGGFFVTSYAYLQSVGLDQLDQKYIAFAKEGLSDKFQENVLTPIDAIISHAGAIYYMEKIVKAKGSWVNEIKIPTLFNFNFNDDRVNTREQIQILKSGVDNPNITLRVDRAGADHFAKDLEKKEDKAIGKSIGSLTRGHFNFYTNLDAIEHVNQFIENILNGHHFESPLHLEISRNRFHTYETQNHRKNQFLSNLANTQREIDRRRMLGIKAMSEAELLESEMQDIFIPTTRTKKDYRDMLMDQNSKRGIWKALATHVMDRNKAQKRESLEAGS